jgi:hypothetical protein
MVPQIYFNFNAPDHGIGKSWHDAQNHFLFSVDFQLKLCFIFKLFIYLQVVSHLRLLPFFCFVFFLPSLFT